jgi:hypothetical protein
VSGSKAFFQQIKDGEQPSLIDGIREAAAALREVGGQIWDAGKPMFDHGRAEAAAALFRECDGHVMYMRGQDGVEQQQAQAMEQTQQREVDGHEM